jgi:hypothetical protein
MKEQRNRDNEAPRIDSLRHLGDVARYWQSCIADLAQRKDSDVAYDMVRVVGSRKYDEWNRESLFSDVFDLVADLETPLAPAEARPEMWKQVKKGVAELEAKYPAA